ncbi:MAG: RidA family protein [Reyranella sp.]|nr:RidA family protein [Reyranella sp.]
MSRPHIRHLTVPDLFPPPGYAHVAVVHSARLILTAGAVPLDDRGALVGRGDYAAQTKQTIDNLLRQLSAAGAAAGDVLKTTVYVVARTEADLAAVWKVVQASALAPAASTLLGVALLGYPGQLVEIEAVAAKG